MPCVSSSHAGKCAAEVYRPAFNPAEKKLARNLTPTPAMLVSAHEFENKAVFDERGTAEAKPPQANLSICGADPFPVLIRVLKRFGQNERSLFSFLLARRL